MIIGQRGISSVMGQLVETKQILSLRTINRLSAHNETINL